MLVILVLVAVFTMTPGAARPDLAARLRAHVVAIATGEHDSADPARREAAARHIEAALAAQGYTVRQQQYKAGGQRVRNIEVSVANVAPDARPDRIFIVGAHYDPAPDSPAADDSGSGAAAVLELARLLRQMQPAQGTEVKFVFFVNEEPPWFLGEQAGSLRHRLALPHARHGVGGAPGSEAADGTIAQVRAGRLPASGLEAQYPESGNFIAFAGTRAASALVRQALAAFRSDADSEAEGLASPSYVEGVTLSDHASGNRAGDPALMITDTAFLRYPYFHTQDSDDKLDYEGMARVVKGLARTIGALAGGTRM